MFATAFEAVGFLISKVATNATTGAMLVE
jgi:hypothetical protein